MAQKIDPNAFRGGKKSLVFKGKTTPLGPQVAVPGGLKPFSQLGLPMSGAAALVQTAGQVVDGFDLRNHDLVIQADNVTVKNCLMNAISYHALNNVAGKRGLKVTCNMFDGEKANNSNSDLMYSEAGDTLVEGNIFIDTPTDMLNVCGGTVRRNALVGSGYQEGAHADGITCHKTNGPLLIEENYIDMVERSDAKTGSNAAFKMVSHFGAMDDVLIQNNIGLGGGYNCYCGDGGAGKPSKVRFINNLLGLSNYGDTEPYFIMGGADPSLRGPGWEWTNNTKFTAAPNDTVSIGGSAAPQPPGKPVCKINPTIEGGKNVGDPAVTASGTWESPQADWQWSWDWQIEGRSYGDTTYKTIAPEPGALSVLVSAKNASGTTTVRSDVVMVAGEPNPNPGPDPEPGPDLDFAALADEFDRAGDALNSVADLLRPAR